MALASGNDVDLPALKTNSASETRPNFNSIIVPRFFQYAIIGTCVGVGLLALHRVAPSMPWTVATSQFAVPANCDAARARGIAPMRRGEPGYHRRLDPNNDGIACGPYLAGGSHLRSSAAND